MNSNKINSQPLDHEQAQGQDPSELNRREFLKRAGKFAVYTPPTLMLLMQPSYAQIAQSGGSQGSENSLNNGSLQSPLLGSNSGESSQNFLQTLFSWLRETFLRDHS